jgi:hypothetical protein
VEIPGVGLNVTPINGTVINGAGGEGAGLGLAPAERFCRMPVDDLNLLRSFEEFNIVRPNDYVQLVRDPSFGRCGQEDACS